MEVAHRGTLFLDEIAEMPLPLQSKLLRALQEKQIRRVGGTEQITVDCRVVSATNRNVRDGVEGDSPVAVGDGVPLQEARDQWMRTLESRYLRDLLERHGGNISAAAKVAGIDRKTFHRLVSKYQIR